mmetsp:Transcript_23514/g.62295  ORF Transcript_23514/g.62295 Transcript_23514/m.62295 type:complete len:236 (+) Transcript_23514:204-911(+)
MNGPAGTRSYRRKAAEPDPRADKGISTGCSGLIYSDGFVVSILTGASLRAERGRRGDLGVRGSGSTSTGAALSIHSRASSIALGVQLPASRVINGSRRKDFPRMRGSFFLSLKITGLLSESGVWFALSIHWLAESVVPSCPSNSSSGLNFDPSAFLGDEFAARKNTLESPFLIRDLPKVPIDLGAGASSSLSMDIGSMVNSTDPASGTQIFWPFSLSARLISAVAFPPRGRNDPL